MTGSFSVCCCFHEGRSINMASGIDKISLEEGNSVDVVADNIEQLKTLFPDVFTDGQIDFDTLRQLLGDISVLKEGEEKYGLNWHGKKLARQVALKPSSGTLLPCPEGSLEWSSAKNIFIEGDNLEVLKLLQKSYANKVKMIYIDPPYNTGKEFIYPDRYQENLETYLKYSRQVDGDGVKFSSNTETTGRMHTNWLSMMLPRLTLARHLLTTDGVIFISIDDNELENLKLICNEVFGEDNFVGTFIWKRRASSALADNNVSMDQDYVVCYQKGSLSGFLGIEKDFKNYKNPDNDPRGPWVLGDLTVGMTASMRPNQAYDLVNPCTGKVYSFNPNRVWAFIPDSMDKMISEGRVFFPDDTSKRPMQKRFKNELKSSHNPISTLIMDKVGLNTEATKQIQEVMGGNLFDYSKPTSLMKLLINQVCTNDGDIVLDFFAGSAATAHSVLEINSEKEMNLRYIMVQLPEIIEEKTEAYSAGYLTISELAMERIKRVSEGLQQKTPELDIGVKLFKLSTSCLSIWNPNKTDIEESLLSQQEYLVEGRSEQDILYELLLKRGVSLSVEVQEQKIMGRTIFNVGNGTLFACLDRCIKNEEIEHIGRHIVKWFDECESMSETHVFFRDSAFSDDVSKTNMVAFLEQSGITHVRSL